MTGKLTKVVNGCPHANCIDMIITIMPHLIRDYMISHVKNCMDKTISEGKKYQTSSSNYMHLCYLRNTFSGQDMNNIDLV